MLPPFLRFALTLGLVLAVVLLVPPEVESKIRVVRQKPKVPPKGTTAKPAAGGGKPPPGGTTTAKPGASSVAPGPGVTTAKPAGSTKPLITIGPVPAGGKGAPAQTAENGDLPPPLTYLKQMQQPDIPGFTFLTEYVGSVFYLSEDKLDKDGAFEACNNLNVPGFRFSLAGIPKGPELDKVAEALEGAGIAEEIHVSVVESSDANGNKVMVISGLFGKFIEPSAAARKRRDVNLVSYANRRIRGAGGKMKNTGVNKPPAPGGSTAGAPDGAGAYVTVWETLYPWLANWTNSGPSCVDTTKCEPTTCEVTTPACTAQTQDCTVLNQQPCSVQPSGNCSMICENCEISKPECYVQEPKCQVVQDRTCVINPPKCSVEAPKCTVDRPQCVSRMPPCNITQNQSPNCTTPPQCLTPQGMDCKEVDVPCDDPNGCKVKECTPLAICIKPDYCRLEQIICPPVETFCPPEVVKCSPPKVTCDEPEILCKEPRIYCPPPTVVCTRPLVNCSAPTVNCPNVVTTCPNPDIECKPPIIDCPQPSVTCTPPTNPCPVDPGLPNVPLCPEVCGENGCQCYKLKQGQLSLGRCEDVARYICEGGAIKTGGGVKPPPIAGGGPKKTAPPAGGKPKKPK